MNRSEQLAGIRLKLARAWQQIDALKPDIKAFIDADPYLPRVNFKPQTHELTVSVEVQRAPDPMWGVRIGEIVHNFRSALDHVVWELVILSTRRAPPRGCKNQFPIFETAAGFDGRGVSQFLRHVRADAVDLIRSEQPFATGEGEHKPPLAPERALRYRQASDAARHWRDGRDLQLLVSATQARHRCSS